MERTTDPSGDVLAVFQKAADDIATIANAAVHLPETFIADLCEAVKTNYYGQADGLIGAVGARLGTDGLARLDVRLHAEPPRATDDEVQERRISRWVRGRTLETEVVARRDAEEMVWRADIELADALGDVERYIALQPDPTTTQASLDIASRLVAAGRDEEAIAWLDRAELRTQDLPEGWQATRLLALEGLGRADAAQALRLLMFKTNLNAAVLRDYLKRLPDFEDVEAEEEALTWAGRSSDADRALQFLVTWPALDRAATLVVDRIEELDSTDHVALQAAAEKMAPRYPLAAIMLLRQAVEDILKRHVSAEYSAAGHLLADITRLSAHISDWAGVPDDDAFQSSLKKRFGAVSPLWRAAA